MRLKYAEGVSSEPVALKQPTARTNHTGTLQTVLGESWALRPARLSICLPAPEGPEPGRRVAVRMPSPAPQSHVVPELKSWRLRDVLPVWTRSSREHKPSAAYSERNGSLNVMPHIHQQKRSNPGGHLPGEATPEVREGPAGQPEVGVGQNSRPLARRSDLTTGSSETKASEAFAADPALPFHPAHWGSLPRGAEPCARPVVSRVSASTFRRDGGRPPRSLRRRGCFWGPGCGRQGPAGRP